MRKADPANRACEAMLQKGYNGIEWLGLDSNLSHHTRDIFGVPCKVTFKKAINM